MARSSAINSIKTMTVIFALAMPAVSFAQATGGVGGSTGGSAGSLGSIANSPAPPPGTNSLGTAQSSGPGTGAAMGNGVGGAADATINAENKLLERKVKSICRGC